MDGDLSEILSEQLVPVSHHPQDRLLSLVCQCLLKEILYSTQKSVPAFLKNKHLSIHKADHKNGRYAQDGTRSLFSLLDFAVLQKLWGLPALELLSCRHLHHPCGAAHQLTLREGQHDSSHPSCASLWVLGKWATRLACLPLLIGAQCESRRQEAPTTALSDRAWPLFYHIHKCIGFHQSLGFT